MRDFIGQEADRLGFSAWGVASPADLGDVCVKLSRFVALERHGDMAWMAERVAERGDPRSLWSGTRSVIMLAMNYGPDVDPMETVGMRDRANISVYARNRDYHDLIKGKLKEMAGRFAARTGADVKVFVDTAPVMEKPLAALAGIGWQGKHTNLVSREKGSWLFLGAIFTAADLASSQAETDHCGSCRACLDACPTKAFPAPYQLDARRCISYLTIENKAPIPHEFRPLMGNRIYGCDDCLAVCPWNKFAAVTAQMKLAARDDLQAPPLAKFLTFDDATFRAHFSGSPVKRIGRDRFIRNVLIAAGNSGMPELAGSCRELLADPAPVVRGAAIWALSRLVGGTEMSRLAHAAQAADLEEDETVRFEWKLALAQVAGDAS